MIARFDREVGRAAFIGLALVALIERCVEPDRRNPMFRRCARHIGLAFQDRLAIGGVQVEIELAVAGFIDNELTC